MCIFCKRPVKVSGIFKIKSAVYIFTFHCVFNPHIYSIDVSEGNMYYVSKMYQLCC